MKLGVTAALAIFSLATFAAAGAHAQQPAARPAPAAPSAPAVGKPQAWQKACQAEIEKVCKEVSTKGGDVADCLAAHEKDLSEECTRIFLWRYKVAQDCKDDLQRLCGEKLASGATTAVQCFNENVKALSEKCRTSLSRGNKRQKAEEKGKASAGEDAKTESKTDAAAKPARKSTRKK